MSSTRLAFSSKRPLTLDAMPAGASATIVGVLDDGDARVDRLLALGVAPGASVRVLQTFPGVVFMCDQTELAVERAVARSILVRTDHG